LTNETFISKQHFFTRFGTATFKKDDTVPVTNVDKDYESVKNPDGEQPNMEEFSEIKSNKEKVYVAKTNTRKILKKQEEIKRASK
jgi:hypothetical protein